MSADGIYGAQARQLECRHKVSEKAQNRHIEATESHGWYRCLLFTFLRGKSMSKTVIIDDCTVIVPARVREPTLCNWNLIIAEKWCQENLVCRLNKKRRASGDSRFG